MKAALFLNGNTFEIKETPEPVPGPDEVKLRIRAAGICGSDLHGWRSGKLWFPEAAPLILGHELAGEVTEIGESVKRIKKDDRVVVQPQITCGKCPSCLEGTYQLCPSVKHIGIWFNGGFAQYATVPEINAFTIPDDLPFDIASMTDVYGCALHCFHRIRPVLRDSVVIIGTGPIALSTAQILKLKSRCRIITVGRREPALRKAREAGAADATVNITTQDPIAEIQALTKGRGADVVVEAVGGEAGTLEMAFEMAALDGAITVMGEFFGKGLIHLQTGMEKQIDLLWSTGYGNWEGASEFEETIDLLSMETADAEKMITHRFPLEDLRAGFAAAENKAMSNAVKVLIIPAGD